MDDRKAFKVTFRWYGTDTYSTNICIANSEDEVRKDYAKDEFLDPATGETKHHIIVGLTEATPDDLQSARDRGMATIVL